MRLRALVAKWREQADVLERESAQTLVDCALLRERAGCYHVLAEQLQQALDDRALRRAAKREKRGAS